MVLLLEQDGHAVARANNGRDALALLRGSLRPSVILLDYHLPSMNARTFRLEQLATELQLDVPVILVSGDAGIEFADLEVQGVLRKPFEHRDLRAVIDDVCGPAAAPKACRRDGARV